MVGYLTLDHCILSDTIDHVCSDGGLSNSRPLYIKIMHAQMVGYLTLDHCILSDTIDHACSDGGLSNSRPLYLK